MFKNRLVRDLSWVISSPPLVSGEINDVHWLTHTDCKEEHECCLPMLEELDKNPEPLIKHISQLKAKGLGHRFEALVAFWIRISPNYKLLANNIQVIIEGHTYGEIDFIIQEVISQKIIHLEVAVKFYLGNAPYLDAFSWYGTNTNDQLGKKVAHLAEKQTQLSITHKSFIKERGFEIDERCCLLKGRLFHPQNIDTSPTGVTENHLRGTWHQGELKKAKTNYYEINKTHWLAKLNDKDIDKERIETELKEPELPTCYSQVGKIQSKEFYEINRLFLLPNNFKFPKNSKN